MNKKLLTLLCLIFVTSGCATYATGPLFKEAPIPNDRKSILYVFQVKSPLVYAPMVKINDKPFVRLTKMGYSYTYLFPGIYKLNFHYGGLEGDFFSEIEIKESQEIFIEYYASGFEKWTREVPKKQALDQFKDFRYIVPVNNEF